MANVLAVLKRDFIRLLKAPAALVVVVALLVLPSLYTWYNVLGFWDPYNNTGNMRVAVVNQDKGGSSDLTGQLNVGDKIVEALEDNHQLNWQIVDYDTAMNDLRAGKDYAVFVVPANFTQDLLTITTGNFKQPVLQYYVNMKTGPVAPKITDTGSGTLEETINATFVATVSDTVVETINSALDQAEVSISEGTSLASQRMDEAIGALGNARGQIAAADGALANAQSARGASLEALDAAQQALNQVSAGLSAVSSQTAAAQNALIEATPKAMEAIDAALVALSALEGVAEAGGYGPQLKAAISALEQCAAILEGQVLPAASQSLGNLSASSAQLAAAAESQQSLIDQARGVLNQLDAVIGSARQTLSGTDGLLATAQNDLGVLRADLLSLGGSNAITRLLENGTLDASAIAEFMGSPTTVVTEKLYELNAYGSAMAPLFMNLTFWIGAFMLIVIMRLEVDSEGIRRLTAAQRYLGRFIMFALFAVAQALICCFGVLQLGVQTVNAPALYAAAAMASLAYLSIIFALSTLLQHVGKGLCIILVFMQIPAATGLYPIEMTAGFYQAVSPLFPFTYGISAMREAICGFYGTTYLTDMLILLGFFALFLVLGVTLRLVLANVNRTFAKEIGESGIYNGQQIEVPGRTFRIAHLARALSDKVEYRVELQKRYERFERRYPTLIRASIIVGAAVPVVIGIVFSLTVGEKATMLSLWLAWMVLLFIFLSVVENVRENINRQLALGEMSLSELHDLYVNRNDVEDEKEPAAIKAAAAAAETEELADFAAPETPTASTAPAAPEIPTASTAPEAPEIPGDTFINAAAILKDTMGVGADYLLEDCGDGVYKRLLPAQKGGRHA